MDWLRENVLPVALGGKTKSPALTAPAMTAQQYQPAPAPTPAPPTTTGMGQLGGRHRRRSHRGRRHHRKTKKHSRR